MCVCSTPLSPNVMYLFGSFCDYDLSDRKKGGISAKKPICRVVLEKVFGLPKVNRWKKNRPDFFLKPYRRFVVVVFFAGKKKLIMRYVFVFILASWLSNKNITGL